MQTFEFIFATFLGEMVLSHSDNLSAVIQKKTTSAAEGQVAKVVIIVGGKNIKKCVKRI